MFAHFYSMPVYSNGAWSALSDKWLFTTGRIVSYEYTKRFQKTGNFSIVLPYDRDLVRQLSKNNIILFDDDCLLVDTIAHDYQQITLSGKDIKGLLDLRITEFGAQQQAGTQGYDVVSGTTAECVEHYLNNNLIAPINAKRMLPVTFVAGAAGLTSDSYMARLEYVSDVVTKLCEGADIGYDMYPIARSSNTFSFKLIQGVDRSMWQNANNRIIFSTHWGNVRRISFENGVSDLYNTVYATSSDDYTETVNRDPDEASGISRRECAVNVSAEHTDSYFSKYALNAVADNTETKSFTVEPSAASGYGTEYQLGDIVTVLDDSTHRYDVPITEVTKSYSHGRRDLSFIFGKPKQKPLQKAVNRLLSGTARRR